MRLLLLLLVAFAFAHASFPTPPVGEVTGHNAGLGTALDNAYNPALASSSALALLPGVRNGPVVPISGSVDIAGMSLTLDGATYPMDGLMLLVARGVHMGQMQSLYGGPCDFSVHSPGCDYDNDGCAEYEKTSSADYAGLATFRMGNITSPQIPFTTDMVPVPRDVLDAMKRSSGTDQLSVSVRGIIRFRYYVSDPDPPGCNDNSNYVDGSVPFYANRSFTVYGVNKLYFLRAPVLREQWYKDNRFDTIVLSQSPLYSAEIWLNGNLTRNMTMRTFDIAAGPYGVEGIVSRASPPAGWSEDVNLTSPILLESSPQSYAYVYAFNYSYDGLGQNALSLVVNDSLGGSARYNEVLMSRMLSYNGTSTENGSPAASLPSRPSAAFTTDYLAPYELALGLLSLLFILSFVNIWLLK